ncbi:MAG: hypothetical protein KC877_03620 [Candidatus Kaiserbacteria bacterium]|nr:hypothetical protein [Candidatus Kaiserbacteria bacterium]MCB9816789.1 hypothetical protein [Candidatus Nomurabacteria bacterium]
MNETTYEWKIIEWRTETPTVKTMVLEPVVEKPTFRAGQYVTILLPGHPPVEGKSYSLSSAPESDEVTITIKKIGTFSSAIIDLPVGATVTTSAPYGFFYPEPEDEGELVFISGGVGITPSASIIDSLTQQQDQRPIKLFYSNRTASEISFRERFATLAKQHDDFTLYYFVTQEPVDDADLHAGRMDGEQIAEKVADLSVASFFVCGSVSFVQGMWQSLQEVGVAAHQIYTEGFF